MPTIVSQAHIVTDMFLIIAQYSNGYPLIIQVLGNRY